jgi:hypothetical protein
LILYSFITKTALCTWHKPVYLLCQQRGIHLFSLLGQPCIRHKCWVSLCRGLIALDCNCMSLTCALRPTSLQFACGHCQIRALKEHARDILPCYVIPLLCTKRFVGNGRSCLKL